MAGLMAGNGMDRLEGMLPGHPEVREAAAGRLISCAYFYKATCRLTDTS